MRLSMAYFHMNEKDKPKRARLIEYSSRSGAWQKYKLDGEPMGRQFSASVPL
jgi:hypothetical protein